MPVYTCAAIAYVIAFLLMLQIRMLPAKRSGDAASSAMVLDGLRYIWRNKLIFGAISLDLFAVLLGGAVALLPVYAREILNVGATGLGILRSAPGVGAVLTAILIAHWPLRRKAGAAMLWCVAGFGIFTIVFGLSRDLALSLVRACSARRVRHDQRDRPAHHDSARNAGRDERPGQRRKYGLHRRLNEVGQFESGITAQWLGTIPAVVLGGIGTIAIVTLWAWLFPSLREVDQVDGNKSLRCSISKRHDRRGPCGGVTECQSRPGNRPDRVRHSSWHPVRPVEHQGNENLLPWSLRSASDREKSDPTML